MTCVHPFGFLREYSTESKPTGAMVLRAYCGNCGAPLTKETMGSTAAEAGARPLEYKPIDAALKPAIA